MKDDYVNGGSFEAGDGNLAAIGAPISEEDQVVTLLGSAACHKVTQDW